MKYENCYLSYANEFYFTARSLPQQQTTCTLFAVHETDYRNEGERTILDRERDFTQCNYTVYSFILISHSCNTGVLISP